MNVLCQPVSLRPGLRPDREPESFCRLQGQPCGERAETGDQALRDTLHVAPRYGTEQDELEEFVIGNLLPAAFRVPFPKASAMAMRTFGTIADAQRAIAAAGIPETALEAAGNV